MFKCNNRSTRTTCCKIYSKLTIKAPERRHWWCLYCWLWTCFTPWPSVSTVNFEQVNAGWVMTKVNKDILKFCTVKWMKDSNGHLRNCLTIRIQGKVLRNQKQKCSNVLLKILIFTKEVISRELLTTKFTNTLFLNIVFFGLASVCLWFF